jgi:hypothetical protein
VYRRRARILRRIASFPRVSPFAQATPERRFFRIFPKFSARSPAWAIEKNGLVFPDFYQIPPRGGGPGLLKNTTGSGRIPGFSSARRGMTEPHGGMAERSRRQNLSPRIASENRRPKLAGARRFSAEPPCSCA